MSFSLTPCAIAVKIFALTIAGNVLTVVANENPNELMDFEVITITNQRHHLLENNEAYAKGQTSEPDLANWLSSVPGANINSNGPVTGIAQYRGLYGDRIAVSLDGHPVIGAGPNAMDTPLSYSTPLIVDAMTVYRGVAPVSAGIDTLAGAIDVKMRKAEIYQQSNVQTAGDLQAGYRGSNNAKTLSSVFNFAKNNTGLMVYGNVQSGDDIDSGDGTAITPTSFEKRQFGADIRIDDNVSEVGFSYHYTDTQSSGTPALPMDIEYIFSHRAMIDGAYLIDGWQGKWLIGFVDADHGMTNFLLRENNNLTKHRRNNATAKTVDFSSSITKTFSLGEIELGVDGYFAKHDSVITNPNNAMFEVVNFNNVVDDRVGLYLQWQQQYDNVRLQIGMRLKHISYDADNVSTSMAMMMQNDMMDINGDIAMNDNMAMPTMSTMPTMAQLAAQLRDDFNHAERSGSDNLVDIALNLESKYSKQLSFNVGVGIKTRAPSYQERFLWTPMESTGGLADGNTYIGDVNLDAETAYQIDAGFNYQGENFVISPHIFYQNIDDYIQGTRLGMANMNAKMMADMMAGDDNPLKFSNVDAKLYGTDVNWRYQLNDSVSLFGVASYVKGERRDITDNLYRVAPLNGQINVSYLANDWEVIAQLDMAAKQDDVSLTNDEQATAGYGVINLDVNYYASASLTVRAGVDNILDKEYARHLGGYNRVKGSDVAVMSRIPSEGMSAWAEVTYSF